MKKYFLLAAAAATVLAVSCNKEKNQPKVDPTPGTEIEDNTPQPVRFGTNIAEVKAPITKGLGAIDDWSNANTGKLYIYGLERTAQAASTYVWNVENNAIHPFINNVAANPPAGGAGLDRRDAIEVLDVNNVIDANVPTYGPYYYVDNKYYDFFGYYVDDAVTGTPAPVYTAATTEPAAPAKLDLDIVIDGSQDIMLASTDKAEDIAWRTDQSKQVNVAMLYSAVSARRTVVPNLNFQHQLSRFVFNVVAADASVLEAARKTSIEGLLLYSNYKGKLTIVGTQGLAAVPEQQKNDQDAPLYYEVDPEDDTKHVWTTTTEETNFPVYFKGLAGTKNTGFNFAVKPNQNDPIPATAQYSDIMVYPGAHSYHFDLLLSQVGTPYTDADHAYVLPLDVTLPNDDVALAGKKYVVNVVVYGLEAVQMTVSLAEWDEVDLGWVDPDATNEAAREEATLTLAQNPAGNIAVGATGYAIEITGATHGDPATAIEDEALNTLKATAYFKSSDNTKVRIDKATGAITAVAAGTATITVTVSNDTYYGSATIDVTVVAAAVPAPVVITCADQNISIATGSVDLSTIATFSDGYEGAKTYALKEGETYDKVTVSADGNVQLQTGAAANDTFTVTISAAANGNFLAATKDVVFTVTE